MYFLISAIIGAVIDLGFSVWVMPRMASKKGRRVVWPLEPPAKVL